MRGAILAEVDAGAYFELAPDSPGALAQHFLFEVSGNRAATMALLDAGIQLAEQKAAS